VEYSSFPTEALIAPPMVNLAAIPWTPSPRSNTIYYHGEQQKIRAEDAMTPEVLAKLNPFKTRAALP